MDKSKVQPAVLDISSRHTIDACLKISIESGTYGVIHNLLKSFSDLNLPGSKLLMFGTATPEMEDKINKLCKSVAPTK